MGMLLCVVFGDTKPFESRNALIAPIMEAVNTTETSENYTSLNGAITQKDVIFTITHLRDNWMMIDK
jgi:hypothetical protein